MLSGTSVAQFPKFRYGGCIAICAEASAISRFSDVGGNTQHVSRLGRLLSRREVIEEIEVASGECGKDVVADIAAENGNDTLELCRDSCTEIETFLHELVEEAGINYMS